MGSGGFFVQSEKFIEEHGGKLGSIRVYGQESNPTTWRLAAMNMAIRGIDFNFGKEPANSLPGPASRPSGRFRDGQPALQYQRLVGKQA